MATPDFSSSRTSGSPAYSLPAIISIICALVSFGSGAALGMLAAIGAICFGVLGVILALLPQTRGAMVSIVSIVLGVIGILAALLKLVF